MKKTRVEIVLPLRNESKFLVANVKTLMDFLKNSLKEFDYSVILAESNSQDNTFEIAKKLAQKSKKINAVHLDKPGRDFALKYCWSRSKADVMAYMDADLSTDLAHIPNLIKAISEQGYDVAIGSRAKKGARVKRSRTRKFLTFVYNSLLLPLILPTGVKDAQCGFKAINKKVAKEIVPLLGEENGFLDTELVAVLKYKKFKIKEISVSWEEKRETVMPVGKNIPNFLKNILKTRIKIIKGYYG